MTYAEAMARYGTDKPDLRFGQELVDCTEFFADTTFRVFQAPYVGAVVMPGGASQPRKQLDAWQEWAKQRGARGPGLRAGRRGRRAGRPGRQEPHRHRAGRPGRATSAPSPATASSSAPARPRARARCSARPAWRSAGAAASSTRTPGRSCGCVDAPLFEPTDRRRGQRRRRRRLRRLDRGAPRVHLAQARVPRHLRHRPRLGAGLRLRHRLQRQRDRRRVDPYPPRATCRSACSRSWASRTRRPRRSSASCSRRSPTAPRRTAASRSAGTASARCSSGADSIREVIAFPKSGGGYDPLTAAPAPITDAAAQGGRRGRHAGAGAGARHPAGLTRRQTGTRAADSADPRPTRVRTPSSRHEVGPGRAARGQARTWRLHQAWAVT